MYDRDSPPMAVISSSCRSFYASVLTCHLPVPSSSHPAIPLCPLNFTALLTFLHRSLYSFRLFVSPRCSCHLRNTLRFASTMSMVLSDIHLLCFLGLPSRCFCVDSSTPFFSSYHLSSTPPCPSLLTKPFSMVSTQSATFVSVARAPHQIVTSSVL